MVITTLKTKTSFCAKDRDSSTVETDRNIDTTSLETKLCATESAPLWRKRHSYNHVRNKDIVICYRQG